MKAHVSSGLFWFLAIASCVSWLPGQVLGSESLGENARTAVDLTCTPVPRSVVSWWAAEGDARDLFGTNHGTFRNGVSFANGIIGQAFSFDGTDDYIDNSPLGWLSDTFTIEFWARPSASRVSTVESVSGYAGTSGQRYAVAPHHAALAGIAGAGVGVSVGTNGISRMCGHWRMGMPSRLNEIVFTKSNVP